jgi:hypothetical protein
MWLIMVVFVSFLAYFAEIFRRPKTKEKDFATEGTEDDG